MKVVAIIQARMLSTRLPGKVLRDLGGQTMLARVVNRTRRAQRIAEVIVATSTLPADDPIAEFCAEQGGSCFRGEEQDVLDRYQKAAAAHHAEVIVRITSDCPLIDAGVLDDTIDAFLAGQPATDYACNFHPHRTFPRGLDAEVFSRTVLDRCWCEVADAYSREHVTAFIYRNPHLFNVRGIDSGGDWSHLRWTVDTPEDYELAKLVYEHFGHDEFDWREALAAFEQHPEWAKVNRHVMQKPHA
jgi:spore coat polysaccharide biosynthesis protein SpsF